MASAAVHQGTALASAPNEGPARDDGWRPLAAGWVVLSTDRLAGFPAGAPRERRFLLMHADYGIVVLELWSAGVATGGAPPAAAWLEAELRLAGFLRRFDPRLPIRRIHLATPELPHLVGVLTRAFAGTEPLRLPCGDVWMGAVQAALAAPDAVPAPAAGFRLRVYPRLVRWRGVAAGAAGATALGGVVIATLLLAEGRPGTEAPRAGTGERPAMLAAPVSADPAAAVMARAPPVHADALPVPGASGPMTPSATAQLAPLPEPEALRHPAFGAASTAATEPPPAPEAAFPAPPIAADAAFADGLPEPEAAPPERLAATLHSAPPPEADAPRPAPLTPVVADTARIMPWPGSGVPRPALPAPVVPHRAPVAPADGDAVSIALPAPPIAAPPPLPGGADVAHIAPLPKPGGAPHPAQRMPRDAGVLPMAPLPMPVAPRLLPVSLAGVDIAQVMLLPMPAVLHPVWLAPAVADTARVMPLPEPDAVRPPPPPLASAAADIAEPGPQRLAQLTSVDTERAAPVPEPDAARLPRLAPDDADTTRAAPLPTSGAPEPAPPAPGGADAARIAPPPEPGTQRITQDAPSPETDAPRPAPAAPVAPAAPSDVGTARVAPAPPPAPASHDTRRVVPTPAPEVPPPMPAPTPEVPRAVPPAAPAAEAVRPPPPVTPPTAAAPAPTVVPAPAVAPAPTLDPKVIELLLTRGNEMLARGDISAARLLFGRAAAAGSVAAFIAMGRSYDPAVLGALGVRGIRPDPEQAALWYRRAAERGAAPDGRSE